MEFQPYFNCFFQALCFAFATTLFRFHHVSSSSEFFKPCRNSFTCGDITGIGYPFRRNSDPDYCSYPGLNLRCNRVRGDRAARIEIMNLKYRVLDIHPETRTMRVAREDVFKSGCPTDIVNTTLDPSSFDYATSSFNLTFLYGCPETGVPGSDHISSCEAEGESGVFVVPGSVGPGKCEDSVVYPVAQTGGGRPVNDTGLDLILRQGFEIRWRVDSSICEDCSRSNGSCGYDMLTRQTSCYCPDPPHVRTTTCAISSIRGKSNYLSLKITSDMLKSRVIERVEDSE